MPTEQQRPSAFARAGKSSVPAGLTNSDHRNHLSVPQPLRKSKNTDLHHRLNSSAILAPRKLRQPNPHHRAEDPRNQASRASKTTTPHHQIVKQATPPIQVRKTPAAKPASMRVSHTTLATNVTKPLVAKPTPTSIRITKATSSQHIQISTAPQGTTTQQKMALKKARRISAIVNEAVYIGVLIYDAATETFYIMKPVAQSTQPETSQPETSQSQSNGPAVIDDLPPLGFCTIEQPRSVEPVVWRVTNPDRNSVDSGKVSVRSRRGSVLEYPSCFELEASSCPAEYRTGVPEHQELFFDDGVSHASEEMKGTLSVPLNSVQQYCGVQPGSSQGYIRTLGGHDITHSPDHPQRQGPLGSRETSQPQFPQTLKGKPLRSHQTRFSVIAELASPDIPRIVVHSPSLVTNSYQFKAGGAQSVSESNRLPKPSAPSAQIGHEASKVGVQQHDLSLQDPNAFSANVVRPLSLHLPTGQSLCEEMLGIFEEKIFSLDT